MAVVNVPREYPNGWRAINILGIDPHDLCANQRIHWSRRASRTKEAKAAARSAWVRAGSPKANGVVRYRLHVCRPRVIDEGAVVEGCKAVIDGIFRDGLTVDDSAKYCILDGIEQVTGKDAFRLTRSTVPRVVVIWWEVAE